MNRLLSLTIESGEILFNSKPLSEYPIPLWRRYIGVVSQQTKIFSGTIGENICFGSFHEERISVMDFWNSINTLF
ncbi:hypothetical protein [Proteiniphilum sp. X52]|uniref:hypothetical protein n=1 Tax=Proteiniphilum sp. X52 TaxID=2382159 RepID=UPI000F09BAAA|nr:hypothetical protein [Proteiniphilum sp. X52]RNC63449.1 hypothetical protein D7D25_16460 [Proteiniphilum sp. X52]